VDLLEERSELGDVEPSRRADRNAKVATSHLAAEREALEVEEARGPLEVGQRVRLAGGEPLELSARRDLKLQRLHELRVVTLQDPEQRRDVARDGQYLTRSAARTLTPLILVRIQVPQPIPSS
jgi:hypothetical protein